VQNYCLYNFSARARIIRLDGVIFYVVQVMRKIIKPSWWWLIAAEIEKMKLVVWIGNRQVIITVMWRNRYYLYNEMHALVLLNWCHILFMYITKWAVPFSQVIYPCFLYISIPFLVKSVTQSHLVCSQLWSVFSFVLDNCEAWNRLYPYYIWSVK
jgi:hypothetical protein